jgi:hypothetical protein
MVKLSPAIAALAGATVAGLWSLAAALPAKAAVVANYQFQNTLSSTIPSAPDLVPFVLGSYSSVSIGGTPTTVYNFGKQQGLSLDVTGLIRDKYTIAALVSFDDISGFRKIFDFMNLTSESGLYTLRGQLFFMPIAMGGPTVLPGTFFEVVLTREYTFTSTLVTAYFDGTPVFSFDDGYSHHGRISPANLLNIFQDDATTGGRDSSSGSVAGLRIFNNVLTDAEVAALDLRTYSAVPGPLPLFGAAAAFGWSRRLRKRIATPLITPPQA